MSCTVCDILRQCNTLKNKPLLTEIYPPLEWGRTDLQKFAVTCAEPKVWDKKVSLQKAVVLVRGVTYG